jgi:4-hydroxy-tetrahydrodipicolinate reductase
MSASPIRASNGTQRLLLVGHGRMGRLVASLAHESGFTVVGAIDSHNAASDAAWPDADVAIDFSTAAAVPATISRLAARRTPVVIGTTGWHRDEASVRETVARAGLGVVAAPNFAIGVNLFLAVAERLGALMASQPSFGAWIHELHHAAKKDAPSGTALALESRVRTGGYTADIPIASTRAGAIPGTHTLGFDAASETITLTHQARDRAAFARGALLAARWVLGKQGWFTMADVLELQGGR